MSNNLYNMFGEYQNYNSLEDFSTLKRNVISEEEHHKDDALNKVKISKSDTKLIDKYKEWIPKNDIEKLAVQRQRFYLKSKKQVLSKDEVELVQKYKISEKQGKQGKQGRFTMKYVAELVKNDIDIATAYYAVKAGFSLDEILKVKGELSESIIARVRGISKNEIIKTVNKNYTVNDVIVKKFGISSKKEKVDGLRLGGNLEMDGNIKAVGFYLNDNSRGNDVAKVALPSNVYYKNSNFGINVKNPESALDIKGNLDVDDKITTNNVVAKKVKAKELISKKNQVDKINSSSINITNPKNYNNPTGWGSHINWQNKAENYLRGKTELRGETNFVGPARINITNPKNANNPTGWGSHFNWQNKAENYIRGKTELRGETNFVGPTRINIQNNKNANNPTGLGSHFNWQNKSENYIRGKTELRGQVNFIDKNKGVIIHQNIGGATHLNYKGRAENYIRGKTELIGEINLPDVTKGLTISNMKNSNNPEGHSTYFNNKGTGKNYIRGSTEIKGPQVNVISKRSLQVSGHGKTSSFGSLNSGWCNIITNASKFNMNKQLNVDGDVLASKICLKDGDKLLCLSPHKLMELIAKGNWRKTRGGYLPGGNNIRKEQRFSNIEQCKTICGTDKNCAGITYRKSDGTCWFKNSNGIKRIYGNNNWLSVIKRDYKTELLGCDNNSCKVGANVGKSTVSVSNPNIHNILDKSNGYEIFTTIKVNNNKNTWRNIYHYGNTNNERGPALWIFPNDPWKFHFRVATNRNSNDGQDFNIPGNLRKYNTDLNIRTKVSQVKQGYWHYYTGYGYRNRTGYRNVTQYITRYRYERRYRNYTYYRNVRRYRRERRRYCRRRHIGWGRWRTRCDYYKYVNVPYTVRQPYTYRRPYNARVPYRQAYTVRRPYTYRERYPIRQRVYRTRENIVIQHWVNNVYVGGRTIYNVNLRRYPGRRFHIKDPWHFREGYDVTNIEIKKI